MNITYHLSTPPDMQFGSMNSDGSWTGMVNELIQNRADIGKSKIDVLTSIRSESYVNLEIMLILAVTDLAITSSRSAVISFASPVTSSHNRLFIKNPTGSFNMKAYSEPLRDFCWIGVGSFCLLCSLGVFILSR